MIRKPWPIVLLALFFFLTPFFNIMLTYFLLKQETTLYMYFYSLVTIKSNYMTVFNLSMPALLAAFAVYNVKKWSYPTLLICIVWAAVNSFNELGANPGAMRIIFAVVLPMLFNIALGSYFLIPSVKTTYYDPRVRWWEAKPRYIVEVNTDVQNPSFEKPFKGKILNLSEGGVFLESTEKLTHESVQTLNFAMKDIQFALSAKVIFNLPDTKSYGLQFHQLSPQCKSDLSKVVGKLKKANYAVSRPIPLWSEDLKKWFFNLIKTGNRLFPETPEK